MRKIYILSTLLLVLLSACKKKNLPYEERGEEDNMYYGTEIENCNIPSMNLLIDDNLLTIKNVLFYYFDEEFEIKADNYNLKVKFSNDDFMYYQNDENNVAFYTTNNNVANISYNTYVLLELTKTVNNNSSYTYKSIPGQNLKVKIEKLSNNKKLFTLTFCDMVMFDQINNEKSIISGNFSQQY